MGLISLHEKKKLLYEVYKKKKKYNFKRKKIMLFAHFYDGSTDSELTSLLSSEIEINKRYARNATMLCVHASGTVGNGDYVKTLC